MLKLLVDKFFLENFSLIEVILMVSSFTDLSYLWSQLFACADREFFFTTSFLEVANLCKIPNWHVLIFLSCFSALFWIRFTNTIIRFGAFWAVLCLVSIFSEKYVVE